MLRLRMLGGLDLEGEASLTSVQRRPLALLTLIAMAGPRGITREKAAAYLWPESDADRARNALNQTVHQIRRTDARLLTSGMAELKLEPGTLTSDVSEFEGAIERGELTRAVELYRGPFLDGVHVRGAAQFERWVAEQRQTLEVRYATALETLARRAEVDHDLETAVRWWRRLVELNPLSARATVGLMRALAASGDETTALQQARIHECLVRDELDALPAPEIRTLVESLRSGKHGVTIATGDAPKRGTVEPHAPLLMGANGGAPSANSVQWFNRRMLVVASVAAAFMSLMLGFVVVRRPPTVAGGQGDAPALDSARVVIGDFTNLTGDSALDIIAPMTVDWVTQGLARSGVMMVVGHSYDIWSRPRQDVTRDDSAWRALGRSTGSRIVLHGSYALSGDTLRIQAVLSDASSGRVLQAIDPVSGSSRDPLSVADRLRQRVTSVMAARLNPELRNWIASAGQPTSFEAYREYADGMAAFADGHMKDAQIHFFRSAVEDTSYTLPLLWAAFALWNTGERDRRDSLVRALTSRRSSMAPLDRAIHDYLQADTNPKAEYEAARRLVQLAPGSEFEWKLGLAARDVGRPHEAIRAFKQLDPKHGWLRSFGLWAAMVDSYNDLGDYDAAYDILRRHAQDMDPADVMYWKVMLAAEQGESSQVQALLSEMAAHARSIRDCSLLHRVVWMSARILHRAGRIADASHIDEWGLAFLDTSFVARETAKDPRTGIFLKFRRAAMLSDMGRLPEAQMAFEEIDSLLTVHGELARNNEPDLEVASLGYLADIALRRGDRDAAQKLRHRILTSPSPGNGGDTYMLARIAALQGQREDAVALLAPIAMAWREHVRLDPDLDTLRSYPPFLALLKVPAE